MEGREPVHEVMGALAALLSGAVERYPAEAAELCRRFASATGEVARLQELVDPAVVAARKEEDQARADELRAHLAESLAQLGAMAAGGRMKLCLPV